MGKEYRRKVFGYKEESVSVQAEASSFFFFFLA
jgi:hypothetical protein